MRATRCAGRGRICQGTPGGQHQHRLGWPIRHRGRHTFGSRQADSDHCRAGAGNRKPHCASAASASITWEAIWTGAWPPSTQRPGPDLFNGTGHRRDGSGRTGGAELLPWCWTSAIPASGNPGTFPKASTSLSTTCTSASPKIFPRPPHRDTLCWRLPFVDSRQHSAPTRNHQPHRDGRWTRRLGCRQASSRHRKRNLRSIRWTGAF